jgi:hypothetical protein
MLKAIRGFNFCVRGLDMELWGFWGFWGSKGETFGGKLLESGILRG